MILWIYLTLIMLYLDIISNFLEWYKKKIASTSSSEAHENMLIKIDIPLMLRDLFS